ncbi:hypothetical protein Zm00014a_034854 [Zea mays]|uniref:Uncharacterized protein n=1 Tax=Zea mays TaxID=4577 RepID=A0A3L6E728_MAIZE|nr:hypothetical protein Zm00014a_034854 [Zea mays]
MTILARGKAPLRRDPSSTQGVSRLAATMTERRGKKTQALGTRQRRERRVTRSSRDQDAAAWTRAEGPGRRGSSAPHRSRRAHGAKKLGAARRWRTQRAEEGRRAERKRSRAGWSRAQRWSREIDRACIASGKIPGRDWILLPASRKIRGRRTSQRKRSAMAGASIRRGHGRGQAPAAGEAEGHGSRELDRRAELMRMVHLCTQRRTLKLIKNLICMADDVL